MEHLIIPQNSSILKANFLVTFKGKFLKQMLILSSMAILMLRNNTEASFLLIHTIVVCGLGYCRVLLTVDMFHCNPVRKCSYLFSSVIREQKQTELWPDYKTSSGELNWPLNHQFRRILTCLLNMDSRNQDYTTYWKVRYFATNIIHNHDVGQFSLWFLWLSFLERYCLIPEDTFRSENFTMFLSHE